MARVFQLGRPPRQLGPPRLRPVALAVPPRGAVAGHRDVESEAGRARLPTRPGPPAGGTGPNPRTIRAGGWPPLRLGTKQRNMGSLGDPVDKLLAPRIDTAVGRALADHGSHDVRIEAYAERNLCAEAVRSGR
ncbi:MAG: hypothetical protein ABR511_00660 [Acidimicrobiales bacterium]